MRVVQHLEQTCYDPAIVQEYLVSGIMRSACFV